MENELRTKILDSTLKVFNKKGLKLTMDDIAENMSISKKTIYREYRSKEELFEAMVDYLFDGIKRNEEEILQSDTLDLKDKIRSLLGAMPEGYREIKFQDLHMLREKYPKIYRKLQKRLENGWEPTLSLLEQGKQNGVIRQDADLRIFKLMMEASIERFFEKDVLKKNRITYMEGLDKVVDILVDGISIK